MSNYNHSKSPKIAIIGAGLCGLTLAIALHKRQIPYTIYESRASLTEIGAGINLGPNAIRALDLIDPSLGERVRGFANRNVGDVDKDLWFPVRVFNGTEGKDGLDDGEIIMEVYAKGTGNMSCKRDELLLQLAKAAGADGDGGRTQFGKRLAGIEQHSQEQDGGPVTLTFADKTTATADLVIGTDGIHSAVRSCLFAAEDPKLTVPHYSQTGGYRAVVSMETWLSNSILAEALGPNGNLFLGKDSYVIHYPVDHGRAMNIGLWTWRKEDPPTSSWMLKSQAQHLLQDFAECGKIVREIVEMVLKSSGVMGIPNANGEIEEGHDGVEYWKAYYHAHQPSSCFVGRVCIIGDAAHSMPPHLGAGAAQAMEDAFVLAEVLDECLSSCAKKSVDSEAIQAALTAYEAVRSPRYQRVVRESVQAIDVWTGVWNPNLKREDKEIKELREKILERTSFLWNVDLAKEASRGRELVTKNLVADT